MSSRKPTGYLAVAADRPGHVGLAEPQGRERVLKFGIMQDRAEPPDTFRRPLLIPRLRFRCDRADTPAQDSFTL